MRLVPRFAGRRGRHNTGLIGLVFGGLRCEILKLGGIAMSRLILSAAAVVIFASSVLGQGTRRNADNQQYIEVPSDRILLTIAAQPDCPVRVFGARYFVEVTGRRDLVSFKAANTGTRSVGSFSVIVLHSNGTGGTVYTPLDVTRRVLRPGEEIEENIPGDSFEIVPLTDEISSCLNIPDHLVRVTVIMVEWIRFTDGSTYHNERAADQLRQFFSEHTE
jgi:hypothetical protein